MHFRNRFQVNAVARVKGFLRKRGSLSSIGIACAPCRSTVACFNLGLSPAEKSSLVEFFDRYAVPFFPPFAEHSQR